MSGELEYLLANRGQRPATQGAQSLGFLLGGGGRAQTEQIRQQAAYRGAQMQDVLAQARQRQQSSIARDNFAKELRDRGEGDLASMILSSGQNLNPSEVANAREHMLKTKIQQELMDAARDPNFDQNRQTRLLEAFEGKPQKHSEVQGDTYFDPYQTPGSQTPQTTAVGQARIKELGSLVNEHSAQADRARAGIGADKAANYEILDTPNGKVRVNKMDPNDTQPVMMGGNPVAKPPKQAPRFTDTERLSLFGGKPDPETGKVTPDPVKLGQFMALQGQSPDKSDAELFSQMQQKEMAENTAAANTPSADMQASLGGLVNAAQAAPAGAGAAPAPAAPKALPAPGAPQVGEIRKGYRFKGGDPSSQTSWEKV